MQKLLPVTPDLISRIMARLSDEYTAHYFYTNFANYAENAGFTNTAKRMRAEAAAELTHAQKLMDFMNNWAIPFTMPTNAQSIPVDNWVVGMNRQYSLEADLYEAYAKDARAAFEIDLSTYNLFTEMVQIQYESVAEAKTILDKIELVGITNKFNIFYLDNEIFG